MRILLVGDYPDDPTLGSSKVVHKLRDEFRAMGHECDALSSRDLGSRPGGRQLRQLVSPVMAYRAVMRSLRERNYDVLDVASAEGLWLGLARRLGRLRGVAVVCRSHGLEHLNYQRMLDDARAGLTAKPWSRRIWYPLSRLSQVALAARLADRLIVLNETDRRFAIDRSWQPADRVDVIAHGVSGAFHLSAPESGARGRGVLFCGSWDLTKGISYLAEAWRLLVEAGKQVPLTVLGPGVSEPHVKGCFAESARHLVTVMPRSPEDEVMEAYRRHDLLVFPSTYEGFGLVVIEAMSQRLPVIATPVGCAVAVIADGSNGTLVPPRNPAALAEAVARLMEDPATRRRIGDLGAKSVAHLSWRRTAEQTLRSYDAALERSR